MAVSTAQVGNMSITTQVVPAGQNNVPGLAGVPSTQSWTQMLAQRKKQPLKSLSAVIILIGVLQLCIGVSMHVAESGHLSLLSRSRVFLLGLVFITVGIITVVMATKESVVRIKICLISHIVNVTSAAIGIVLYAVQLYTEIHSCWTSIDGSSGKNICVPDLSNSSTTTESPYNRYHYYDYYSDYPSYVYTLRVSLNALILSYIIVCYVISGCIIFLRWKSLKETRYSLLGN